MDYYHGRFRMTRHIMGGELPREEKRVEVRGPEENSEYKKHMGIFSLFHSKDRKDGDFFIHDGEKWTISNIQEKAMQGPPGMRGNRGENGESILGPRGPPGIQGLQGPPGPRGKEGEMGPRGFRGEPGLPGKDGKDGIDGLPGNDGVPGPPGKDGVPGLPGKDGRDGFPGKDGLPGPPGKDGRDGIDGMDGNDGLPGPPGKDGKDGLPGPPGKSVYYGNEENKNTVVGVGTKPDIGSMNSFYGHESGKNETSNDNSYFGSNSGTAISGGMNSFFGSEAGRYSSGTQNTYMGAGTCAATGSNGSYNFFGGAEAGYNNTSGFGNTFSGAVSGSANTEGCWNTFSGQGAGQSNTTGKSNAFFGANSGLSCVSGNGCICVGERSDTLGEEPSNQIVIGNGVVSYGDDTVTFPNNLRTMPSGTEVCFSSPKGGCLFPISSTIRWKEDVRDIGDVLDTEKLYDLRPVTFKSKGSDDFHVGLIAEEVNKLFPVLVPKDDFGLPASVKYSMVSILLLAEIKKLRKELTDLKQKFDRNK